MSSGIFLWKNGLFFDNTIVSKTKGILITLFISSLLGGSLLSEETVNWIGSYSSNEWEEYKEESDKGKNIYYQWQIESLKKSVPPRYIRLLDIHSYSENGKLLNKGILFTYEGLRNKNVLVCGNFLQWKCKPMRKNKFGIFYLIQKPKALNEDYTLLTNYEYKYKVDGIYRVDPANPSRFRHESGSEMSRYFLEETDVDKFSHTKVLENSSVEEEDLRTVLFQIFLPETDTVSIIGNFNNWNYEADYMKRKPDGSFELKLKLPPGTYYYKFIADGEELTDTYNPNVKIREPFKDLVSELIVPERKKPLERNY